MEKNNKNSTDLVMLKREYVNEIYRMLLAFDCTEPEAENLINVYSDTIDHCFGDTGPYTRSRNPIVNSAMAARMIKGNL